MKKIVLSMTAMAVLFFTACEKDAVNPESLTNSDSQSELLNSNTSTNLTADEILALTTITPVEAGKGKKIKIDSLSSVITSYINTNYAGATIKSAFQDKDGNIAVFIKDKDGKMVILFFDKDGKFIKSSTPKDNNGGSNAIDSNVLKAIKDYITEHYSGATVLNIKKDKDGGFTVTVKNKDGKIISLTFDKDGKFIKETAVGGGGGIDPTVLTTIKGYIADKYPGSTFGDVKKNKDGTYTVLVKTADGKKVELTFDKDGKFLKEKVLGTSPTVVKLPDAASTYIKTNYPDGKIVGLVVIDKNGNYVVTVKTSKGLYILYFDKDGKFIKEVKK
jgi:hypothetical protein